MSASGSESDDGADEGAVDAPGPDSALRVDLGGIATADIGTVGALASCVLEARRRGALIRFVGASPELTELIALCGLTRVLPLERRRSIEPRR